MLKLLLAIMVQDDSISRRLVSVKSLSLSLSGFVIKFVKC